MCSSVIGISTHPNNYYYYYCYYCYYFYYYYFYYYYYYYCYYSKRNTQSSDEVQVVLDVKLNYKYNDKGRLEALKKSVGMESVILIIICTKSN